MSPSRPKLTLFLDVVSPFAYFAFYITKNSRVFTQCDVEYVPIFLGAVMQQTGNVTPISIPAKGAYLQKERERWGKTFKIPVADKTPEPFPQPTLTTQRVLCLIQQNYPEKLTVAFEALYDALWVRREPVGKLEVLSAALSKVLGKEQLEQVMGDISAPATKQLLLSNTNRALGSGAFGLPWFECTNAKGEKDVFWGVDHLGQVVEFLGLEKEGDGFRSLL